MTLSRGERALLALCAVYFLFSAALSALAPCGSWDNVVFGAKMWNEGDPGGYYIPSAHELYSSHGRLLYPGHPGLTLQILLHAIQAAYYAICAPTGAGFAAFIASHLARLARPAALVGYTVLIWAYRSAAVSGDFHGFHYLFPFMLLAGVFFGLGSEALLARAGGGEGPMARPHPRRRAAGGARHAREGRRTLPARAALSGRQARAVRPRHPQGHAAHALRADRSGESGGP